MPYRAWYSAGGVGQGDVEGDGEQALGMKPDMKSRYMGFSTRSNDVTVFCEPSREYYCRKSQLTRCRKLKERPKRPEPYGVNDVMIAHAY